MRNLLLVVLTVLSVMGVACAPTPPQPAPLLAIAPPAYAKDPINLFVRTVSGDQVSEVMSPNIIIRYLETRDGSGGLAGQFVDLLNIRKRAIMREVRWGDYLGGVIVTNEYYGSRGQVVSGQVLLETKLSLLQWLTGRTDYTFDRSKLYLEFEATPGSEEPILNRIDYFEYWGAKGGGDAFAIGLAATWEKNLAVVPQKFHRWGFWETTTTPFTMITEALDSTKAALASNARIPNSLIVDEDSVKEVVGRQTGLKVYRDGKPIGRIDFEYRNDFGTSPNTNFFGSSALSRVEWDIDGQYHTLLLLTPALSPEPTTIYLFMDDRAAAEAVLSQADQWPLLYEKIRNRQLPHVLVGVHAMGNLKDIVKNIPLPEGKSTSVNMGVGGGIGYSIIGKPSYENIRLLRTKLNWFGQGALRATGFYYAYRLGSGNGLFYYLTAATLINAPAETVLDIPSIGMQLLDQTGFPGK